MRGSSFSPVVSVLCGLLATASGGGLLLNLLSSHEPPPARGIAALSLLFVASLGVSLPWSQWMPSKLHYPGDTLALVSVLAGWIALGAVPLLVVLEEWSWLPLAIVVPLLVLAVWMRKRWAYVPGLVVAFGVAIGGIAWLAMAAWRRRQGEDVHEGEFVNSARLVIGDLCVVVALRAWRRDLDSAR